MQLLLNKYRDKEAIPLLDDKKKQGGLVIFASLLLFPGLLIVFASTVDFIWLPMLRLHVHTFSLAFASSPTTRADDDCEDRFRAADVARCGHVQIGAPVRGQDGRTAHADPVRQKHRKDGSVWQGGHFPRGECFTHPILRPVRCLCVPAL